MKLWKQQLNNRPYDMHRKQSMVITRVKEIENNNKNMLTGHKSKVYYVIMSVNATHW